MNITQLRKGGEILSNRTRFTVAHPGGHAPTGSRS